jgi:hypothetical protein
MLLKGHGSIRANGINVVGIEYRQRFLLHGGRELRTISDKEFTVNKMVLHALFNFSKAQLVKA